MKNICKSIGASLTALALCLLCACSAPTQGGDASGKSSVQDSEISATDSSKTGSTDDTSADLSAISSDTQNSAGSENNTNEPKTDFEKYVSNTAISTGNNFFLEKADNITYRAYFPLEQYGELEYKFYFSNTVDSTYNYKGDKAYVGKPGGSYTVSNACIADGGTGPDDEITNRIPVTFDGKSSKEVTANETYWSDTATINIEKGHYLVWEWTVNGEEIPCTKMSTLTSTTSSTDGENFGYCDEIPLPQLIGAERGVKHTVAAIGDSITQGCQTEFMAYEFWAAQFADRFGEQNSFYNCGLGWARASDAAVCGDWLNRAKYADIVLVAFGTNDIGAGNYGGKKNTAEEIEVYLTTIVTELKSAGCTVILFNSPPQGYKEKNEAVRTALNERIPTLAKELGAEYFDFAGLLCDPSDPVTPLYGGHPNGEAGKIIADELMKQFGSLFE